MISKKQIYCRIVYGLEYLHSSFGLNASYAWKIIRKSAIFAIVLSSSSSVLAANFPFNLDLNHHPLSPLFDNSDFPSEHPAGIHGRVVSVGDELVFEDGTPARFWGIGLTFPTKNRADFPPKLKEDARRFALELKALGFNHVRFVGFDSSAGEPMKSWKSSGRIDSELLDRFDYLVSELRKAGIYYTLNINNSSVLLLNDLSAVIPNQSQASRTNFRRYKHIRLFVDAAIKQQLEWYRAFFGHVNPYTELSYAMDPANVYVSVANEDSIFSSYFRDFSNLDSYYKNLLNQEFFQYINTKYSFNNSGTSQVSELPQVYKDCYSDVRGKEDVKVLIPEELLSSCKSRQLDTIEFLMDIDSRLHRRMRVVLDELGYTGLFTGTNNWYGYGGLAVNANIGNYIEIHGYFDHPKKIKTPIVAESVTERSYINSWLQRKEGYLEGSVEHSFPLDKAFRSALVDRPLVISEWNHAQWSRFGYEGYLMIPAYAAFQGYPILDLHTYFNHPKVNLDDKVPYKAFALRRNAVAQALIPTLSLAFLRGDIESPTESTVYTCAETREEFLLKILEYGLKRENVRCGFEPAIGFKEKVRTKLYGNSKTANASVFLHKSAGDIRTSNEQIIWRLPAQNSVTGGVFIIDTPKFKAIASPNGNIIEELHPIRINLDSDGVVSIISLDGKELGSSESMLVTTVKSARNSNDNQITIPNKKIVLEPGTSPINFETSVAGIHINTKRAISYRVCAMYLDGQREQLQSEYLNISETGLTITVGQHDTPWYWVISDETKGC